MKHSSCRSSFAVNCSFSCLKSDANTALMAIILVGFEMWSWITWSFIYFYKVQQTPTREWHLFPEWLFPWRKWCILSKSPSCTFIHQFLLFLESSHETTHMMSQHEGRGTSFMLEALQDINMLHGNAPTIWILDEQFAITCKEGWADLAVLFQFS